jgi:hypothetical protein
VKRTTGRSVLSISLLASLWMLPASCGDDNQPQPLAPADEISDGESLEIEPGARFVVDIVSARGETLKTVIIAPDTAAEAAVILLEGDDGTILLGGTTDAPDIQSEGFLARNADAFASEGLLVALVGVPSDYPAGVDINYRISVQQSDDVAAVVAWIDARKSIPVWVLGMSLGTYSATNSAIRLNGVVDGFAVCSASTAPTGGSLPNGILDMNIAQIGVPALVVGHQDDACPGTPATGVTAIAAGLTSAASVTQKIFTGGSPPESQPCGSKSPHGYFGIDQQVVAYMAGVMR